MSDQPTRGDRQELQVGSSVLPLYVERKMKVYAITEHELESLSTRNAQTTAFYSIGSFILSAAISVWGNAIFYTELPAPALVAKYYGAPLSGLMALVFFGLGLHAARSRKSTWQQIKAESVTR